MSPWELRDEMNALRQTDDGEAGLWVGDLLFGDLDNAGCIRIRTMFNLPVDDLLVSGLSTRVFRFSQGYIRDVCYQRMLHLQRKRLHRSAANSLEDFASNSKIRGPYQRTVDLNIYRHWVLAGERDAASNYYKRCFGKDMPETLEEDIKHITSESMQSTVQGSNPSPRAMYTTSEEVRKKTIKNETSHPQSLQQAMAKGVIQRVSVSNEDGELLNSESTKLTSEEPISKENEPASQPVIGQATRGVRRQTLKLEQFLTETQLILSEKEVRNVVKNNTDDAVMVRGPKQTIDSGSTSISNQVSREGNGQSFFSRQKRKRRFFACCTTALEDVNHTPEVFQSIGVPVIQQNGSNRHEDEPAVNLPDYVATLFRPLEESTQQKWSSVIEKLDDWDFDVRSLFPLISIINSFT